MIMGQQCFPNVIINSCISHSNGIYKCCFDLSRFWSVVSSVQFDFTPCIPSSFKLFNAKQKAIMQVLVADILN